MVNDRHTVVNQILTRLSGEVKTTGGRTDGARGSGPKEDSNTLEQLRESVEERPAQESLAEKLLGRSLKFEIDRELNQVVVKVVDKETGEVIRQIPPEEYVEIMKRLQEVNGVFLDREV
jgi:flagellar protein FlaG